MDRYSKEQRKEYNKKYYQDKKTEKGLKPIICEYCNKTVCSNAYKKHLETSKCQLEKLKKNIIEKNL